MSFLPTVSTPVSLDPSHPSDLVLTPLSNELWASWKAGPGARDSYVLKLSGPVENTTNLGPEECDAVFPGPLPPGHYTLGLKVLAGPYDAWTEASTWLTGESDGSRAQAGRLPHRESAARGTTHFLRACFFSRACCIPQGESWCQTVARRTTGSYQAAWEAGTTL